MSKNIIKFILSVSNDVKDTIKSLSSAGKDLEVGAKEVARTIGDLATSTNPADLEEINQKLIDLGHAREAADKSWNDLVRAANKPIVLFTDVRKDMSRSVDHAQREVNKFIQSRLALGIPLKDLGEVAATMDEVTSGLASLGDSIGKANEAGDDEEKLKAATEKIIADRQKLSSSISKVLSATASSNRTYEQLDRFRDIIHGGTEDLVKAGETLFSKTKEYATNLRGLHIGRALKSKDELKAMAEGISKSLEERAKASNGQKRGIGEKLLVSSLGKITGIIKTFSGVLDSMSVPMLILGGFTQLIGLIFKAQDAARELLRGLVETRGLAGMGITITSSMDENDVKAQLNTFEKQVNDFTSGSANNFMILGREEYNKIQGELSGIYLPRLAQGNKKAAESAKVLNGLVTQSAMYSLSWGVSTGDVSKFVTTLTQDFAQTTNEIGDSLGDINKEIANSGVSGAKFFSSLMSISGSMGGLGYQVRDTTALLATLYKSKIFGGKEAEDLINQLLNVKREDPNKLLATIQNVVGRSGTRSFLQGIIDKVNRGLEGENKDSGRVKNIIARVENLQSALDRGDYRNIGPALGEVMRSGIDVKMVADILGEVASKATGKENPGEIAKKMRANNVLYSHLLGGDDNYSLILKLMDSYTANGAKTLSEASTALSRAQASDAKNSAIKAAKSFAPAVTGPLKGTQNFLEGSLNQLLSTVDQWAEAAESFLPFLFRLLGKPDEAKKSQERLDYMQAYNNLMHGKNRDNKPPKPQDIGSLRLDYNLLHDLSDKYPNDDFVKRYPISSLPQSTTNVLKVSNKSGSLGTVSKPGTGEESTPSRAVGLISPRVSAPNSNKIQGKDKEHATSSVEVHTVAPKKAKDIDLVRRVNALFKSEGSRKSPETVPESLENALKESWSKFNRKGTNIPAGLNRLVSSHSELPDYRKIVLYFLAAKYRGKPLLVDILRAMVGKPDNYRGEQKPRAYLGYIASKVHVTHPKAYEPNELNELKGKYGDSLDKILNNHNPPPQGPSREKVKRVLMQPKDTTPGPIVPNPTGSDAGVVGANQKLAAQVESAAQGLSSTSGSLGKLTAGAVPPIQGQTSTDDASSSFKYIEVYFTGLANNITEKYLHDEIADVLKAAIEYSNSVGHTVAKQVGPSTDKSSRN